MNFFVVPIKAVEDHKLSWGAKGLVTFLASQENGISLDEITDIFQKKGGRRDAIRSFLKELIENGYCSIDKIKNDKSQFVRTEYRICRSAWDAI